MSRIPTSILQDNNRIPVAGLGTWRLNGRQCIRVVKKAIDLGYSHIDTAEMYGNEAEIGKAIKGYDRSGLLSGTLIYGTLRS